MVHRRLSSSELPTGHFFVFLNGLTGCECGRVSPADCKHLKGESHTRLPGVPGMVRSWNPPTPANTLADRLDDLIPPDLLVRDLQMCLVETGEGRGVA